VPQKTLYILRHAKAQEGQSGQEDHDRQLNARGIEAAKQMGKYLHKQKFWPDKVLCSTSARTVETLMKIEEVYKHPLPVEYSDKLYLASANGMLNVVASVPEEVSSLMLIGHNPGMHQLCVKLARVGDAKLLEKLLLKFPTCALAVIDLGSVPWRDVGKVKGELKNFITPKMLEE
jgi:phosphohistidine phosphatase